MVGPEVFDGGEDDTMGDQELSNGDESWRKCPGCLGRMSKEDPAHSRTPGICKHPLVEPIEAAVRVLLRGDH